MSSGITYKPGRQPSRSEQLLLVPLIELKYPGYDETVVIHHITEDTPRRLQLEIERRVNWASTVHPAGWSHKTKCFFERIYL